MTLTNRLSNPGLRTLAIGLVAMALAIAFQISERHRPGPAHMPKPLAEHA